MAVDRSGATATDDTDGDITNHSVNGTVDITVGTYTLIYSVADAAVMLLQYQDSCCKWQQLHQLLRIGHASVQMQQWGKQRQ